VPAAHGEQRHLRTHMRDEGDRVVDSLEETFRIGRELGVPVVISHHKLAGKPKPRRSPRRCRSSRGPCARKNRLDCYPYCASSRSSPRAASDPRRSAGDLVEAASGILGNGIDGIARDSGCRSAAVEKLLPPERIYFSMDERTCSAFSLRAHHDRLRRPTARRRPASRLWERFRGCWDITPGA